ncbi:MAG: SDR family oxidoreductase [Acidimicrobiales bacterium]
MSVVLVTGGTGTLGRRLVMRLRGEGHEVRVLSRRASQGAYVGDLTTGVGIDAAASGVDLVVHAASDTRRLGRSDLEQTRNLLRVCSGIGHFVYVSIVGIDVIPFGYYRRKLACEREIEGAALPITILRATQFHELIAMVLRAVERLPVAPLPLDFRFQPVAATDVAGRLCEVVAAEPAGGVVQFGGPEVLTLAEMAQWWRTARGGRPSSLWRLPIPGGVANGFRKGLNTCPDQAVGTERWADYVAGSVQ